MAQVYIKTEKGVAELNRSKACIEPQLASLLFMVDGRKTVDELHALFLARGAPDNGLDLLELGGYIAKQEQASAASVQPVTRLPTQTQVRPLRPSNRAPSEAGVSKPESQAQAYQALYLHLIDACKEHLGMVKSWRMQMAIERASNMVQLRALVKPLEDAVARKQGLDQGNAFRSKTEMLIRKISSNVNGLRKATTMPLTVVPKRYASRAANSNMAKFTRSHG